ncbi:MAG: choice-of-anchor J domain-containing protein [Anaerolineae bacterium]|nr:choice-of-anchor J domain-containing protein [Gloeobacterales cyanobacterium ES-bin-313]
MKNSLSKVILLTALASAITVPANAAGLNTLNEGFNNISTLALSGWAFQNNSNPTPAETTSTANWGQGVAGNPINAQSGAANSYISVSGEDSTAGDANGENGTVSNWLITPELNFQGSYFTFFTRTSLGAPNPPYLEVRLSNNGSSTNVGSTASDVGDFTTVITALGSLDGSVTYPGALSTSNAWQAYTFLVSTSGSGRIAFRYYTPNGGPNGAQSSLIGIDTVSYGNLSTPPSTPPTIVVPEPSSVLGLLTLGGFGLTASRRGKSKNALR